MVDGCSPPPPPPPPPPEINLRYLEKSGTHPLYQADFPAVRVEVRLSPRTVPDAVAIRAEGDHRSSMYFGVRSGGYIFNQPVHFFSCSCCFQRARVGRNERKNYSSRQVRMDLAATP